jgi:retron-type reverse transcriptase
MSNIFQNRRYVFAIHGRSCFYGNMQRMHQTNRKSIYRPILGHQPTLEEIIHPENLLNAYLQLSVTGGEAPGVDGLRYCDFSVGEMAKILKIVSHTISVFSYRPYPTRSVRIPKTGNRFRELQLPTVIDRVIAKSLQYAISPAIDASLLPGVYGFRAGRGIWDMLLAIERTASLQNRWVLAIDDIRDAFPSILIDDVLSDLRGLFSDTELLRFIETVLRGYRGQEHTRGIDQGIAVGPDLLNLRLHHALDQPFTTACPGTPPWFRWADNLVYLCQSVSEGSNAQILARDLLQNAGFTLKGEDGPPVNLRRQGARVAILGFLISLRQGRLHYELPRSSWDDLGQALEKAHQASNPVDTANATIRGWLNANGPALESAELATAQDENDSEQHDRRIQPLNSTMLARTSSDVCEPGISRMISRIRQIAAQMGFREIIAEATLLAWMRNSCQQWQSARERVFRGGIASS